MAKMGLEAIYRRPRTSQPHPQHPVYPYLLRGMAIDRPNQVMVRQASRFIPVRHGFLYLRGHWRTGPRGKVLSWRLSNTMRRLLRRGVEGSHQKVRSARSPNTIKGRSSPDRPGSHADQKKPACAYPWMAGAGAWITSSSNACGESLKQEAVYL
ncbi:IS3 family transposase, partial [Jhaorihella thermophila]